MYRVGPDRGQRLRRDELPGTDRHDQRGGGDLHGSTRDQRQQLDQHDLRIERHRPDRGGLVHAHGGLVRQQLDGNHLQHGADHDRHGELHGFGADRGEQLHDDDLSRPFDDRADGGGLVHGVRADQRQCLSDDDLQHGDDRAESAAVVPG